MQTACNQYQGLNMSTDDRRASMQPEIKKPPSQRQRERERESDEGNHAEDVNRAVILYLHLFRTFSAPVCLWSSLKPIQLADSSLLADCQLLFPLSPQKLITHRMAHSREAPGGQRQNVVDPFWSRQPIFNPVEMPAPMLGATLLGWCCLRNPLCS